MRRQLSPSSEHQEFIAFLQRLLSPVLEAYAGAAIFVLGLEQPITESDYTTQLFRFLLARTEKGAAAYGQISTIQLIKLYSRIKLCFISIIKGNPPEPYRTSYCQMRALWDSVGQAAMPLIRIPGPAG